MTSSSEQTTALIAEAREFSQGWERDEDKRAWRPFDQAERIRHWDETHPIDSPKHAEYVADRRAWEEAHAHDVRLKCYPEFQCAVIESYAADLAIRLADALEAATKEKDQWWEAAMISTAHESEMRDQLAPRVVSTVAELDALPRQSVLISDTGTGPYRKTEEGWVSHFSGPYSAELMVEPALVSQPLIVLWVGGTE